ncbi:MAG: ATPase [Gorillibacterium sp.]|nr:ATPase [Gorillibacterium sp.]
MPYYMGIDAGGSKTLAVITDELGRIIGRGISGCGNHQVGRELAKQSISEASERALQAAGLKHSDVSYALFGLAGADRETDYRILRPIIAEMQFENYSIVCDTEIGLRAGTNQPSGIVLISGTGTNSFGVNKSGQSLQCGGFGYNFGDFGGGSDLAIEVFRSVIRSWEGREQPTLLTQATLAMLGYADVELMFNDYLDHLLPIPKDLTKLLFAVAKEDEKAREILKRQGVELGIAAKTIIQKLGMQQDTFDVVLVGSVLTRGDKQYIAPYIEQEIRTVAPYYRLKVLAMEPVAGAILMAMDRSGVEIVDEVYRNLETALTVKEA